MRPDGATVRIVWLSALPLLALTLAGPARFAVGWPVIVLSWALVTAAGTLASSGEPSAPTRWALWLWLYATPLLGFLREGPDPTVAAAALAAAAGLDMAARGGQHSRAASAGAALGALVGLAIVLAGSRAWAAPSPPELGVTLFSSRRGLLFHWPVLWAGLLGLPACARRFPPLAAASLTGVALVLGAASFLPDIRPAAAVVVLPFLFPGLAAFLEAARQAVAARPLLAPAALAVLAVTWNLLLMQRYRDEQVPRDDTVSFADVAEGNARLWAERAGSPVAWPANWILALRHDVSPARFDLLVGKALPEWSGRREVDLGRPDLDQALLAEGWSVRHPCGTAICRAVEGRARLFLPLPAARAGVLVVVAGEAGRLEARVNGRPLGWLPVTPFTEARLALPPGSLHRGVNEIVLEAPDGPLLIDRLAVADGGGG